MDVETEAKPLRFFADAMLGRLAKRLRLAGFDTAYRPQIDDTELLLEAGRENRRVITRDRLLARRRLARTAILLRGNAVDEQWKELTSAFPHLKAGPRFTRCAACNGLLEKMERDEARPLIPPYVYRTQENFSQCPRCKRIYWAGTHISRIENALR